MADRGSEGLAPARADNVSGGAGAAVSTVRRRYSLLTRRDKLALALMVGIPLFFDLALIWGPTIASVLLSFTNWNGIGGGSRAELIRAPNNASPLPADPLFLPAPQPQKPWPAFPV